MASARIQVMNTQAFGMIGVDRTMPAVMTNVMSKADWEAFTDKIDNEIKPMKTWRKVVSSALVLSTLGYVTFLILLFTPVLHLHNSTTECVQSSSSTTYTTGNGTVITASNDSTLAPTSPWDTNNDDSLLYTSSSYDCRSENKDLVWILVPVGMTVIALILSCCANASFRRCIERLRALCQEESSKQQCQNNKVTFHVVDDVMSRFYSYYRFRRHNTYIEVSISPDHLLHQDLEMAQPADVVVAYKADYDAATATTTVKEQAIIVR